MVKCIFRVYPGPILLYTAVTIISVQAFWSAFDLISIENSHSGIVTSQLKVTRYNKTTYAISGTVDLTADINDDYDCELKAYISSQGTSKYTLLPYKIPRDACCTHLESAYWRGIEKDLQDCSDIPARNGNEKFCLVLKKRKHEMKQFGFNYNVIPKYADVGTYKIEIMMYEKGSPDVSSIATFVARLY